MAVPARGPVAGLLKELFRNLLGSAQRPLKILTGIRGNSTEGGTKSCTWRGITPAAACAGGWSAPAGHKPTHIDHKPKTTYPWGRKVSGNLGCQQVKGSPRWDASEGLGLCWAPQCAREVDLLALGWATDHWGDQGLEAANAPGEAESRGWTAWRRTGTGGCTSVR